MTGRQGAMEPSELELIQRAVDAVAAQCNFEKGSVEHLEVAARALRLFEDGLTSELQLLDELTKQSRA